MKSTVKPIPDGFHTVTPYLHVKNAAKAIEFYQRAFGARERYRLPMPDGRIGHAELQIGDSIVMLADEFPEHGGLSPETLKGTAVGLAFYSADVDAAFQRAVDAGGTVKEPLGDKFWGDRAGTVVDPFGHKWTLLMHIEEVSPQEMKRRLDQMCAAGSEKGSG